MTKKKAQIGYEFLDASGNLYTKRGRPEKHILPLLRKFYCSNR